MRKKYDFDDFEKDLMLFDDLEKELFMDEMKKRRKHDKRKLGGILVRVNIPPGAVINLANILEISSPKGINLIVRIPILGGDKSLFDSLLGTIKQAGGTVEVIG